MNKFDTNTEKAEKVKSFCKERKLVFAGRIPFVPNTVKAVNNGKTIVDIDCLSGAADRFFIDKGIRVFSNIIQS